MPFLRLFLLFLATVNGSWMAESCEIPDGDRQLILSKVKAQIVDALGQPPPPATSSSPAPSPSPRAPVHAEKKTVHKRHSKSHGGILEDTSQVILFPTSDEPCESPDIDTPHELVRSFTYIFRPSPHTLSRKVTSAQLWFYTGGSVDEQSAVPRNMHDKETNVAASPVPPDQTPRNDYVSASESSTQQEHQLREALQAPVNHTQYNDSILPLIDLQILSDHGPVTMATSRADRMDDWTVFHLAPAFLHYVMRGIVVLMIHCQTCPCSDQPEYTPFLLLITHPTHRARRSGVPWSPSALEILQRPPTTGDSNAHCHRGSLNISFEELGWDQWIVHPGSFQFHYCHGTCTPSHGLSPALHWGHCCAALPSTMKSLRVTTTTDGGFSYRYETVPNLLTQDCACS